MALSYANVFGDVGTLIGRLNSYAALAATTLPADLATLVTQFGTRWLPPEGIASFYEGLQADVGDWRRALASYIDQRLLDVDTVQVELGLTNASLSEILTALYRQMLADSQTVKRCNTSVGSVSAPVAPTNAGDGMAYPTLLLDGYSSPGTGMAANVYYAGEPTELCVSETMVLECVSDSTQSGLSEGSESWSWTGGPQFGEFDDHAEGSGPGPGLQTGNVSALVAGKDFASFSGNVPSGWTLASGTAGTHTNQDTSVYFRGASSLKLSGDGATTIQLTQAVSPSLLQAKRRYFLSVALRASATAAGAGFTVNFGGTGYAAGADEVSVPGGSFPAGSWALYAGWVQMPAVIPSDWKLRITATGLPAGVDLWVDSLVFEPVHYHGGVGVNVVAGSTPWQRGDRLSFAVTNDNAGVFQTFFRRHYGVQLPSTVTGSVGPGGLLLGLLLMPQTVAATVLDSWAA